MAPLPRRRKEGGGEIVEVYGFAGWIASFVAYGEQPKSLTTDGSHFVLQQPNKGFVNCLIRMSSNFGLEFKSLYKSRTNFHVGDLGASLPFDRNSSGL